MLIAGIQLPIFRYFIYVNDILHCIALQPMTFCFNTQWTDFTCGLDKLNVFFYSKIILLDYLCSLNQLIN